MTDDTRPLGDLAQRMAAFLREYQSLRSMAPAGAGAAGSDLVRPAAATAMSMTGPAGQREHANDATDQGRWQRLAPIFRAAGDLYRNDLLRLDPPRLNLPDPGRFASLMERIRPAAQRARLDGLTGNVWKAAGVGRDEVRNTKLLGVMISQGASHGLGREVLTEILRQLRTRNPDRELPSLDADAPYTVLTEHCSFGERENRFDLLVTLPGQIVLIEAKIGAPESDEQLRRYEAAAENRRKAANLQKSFIVSLTLQRQPRADALVLSWRDVAEAFSRTVADLAMPGTFSSTLLRQYARHCRTL